MEEPKRSMSREELYALVWSTPMQKLAETYGLSDRGLAKTCQRHLVPVPSRGYWARVEAGQTVKRTPLRPVENTALHHVRIGSGQPRRPSAYLLEVLETAKREIEIENERMSLVLNQAPLLGPSITHAPETLPVEKERVGKKTASKLQSDVQSFVSALRTCEADRDGFVYHKYVKVPPKDVTRVGALLSALTQELSYFGFTFDGESSRIGFSKDGTTVNFRIEAPRKRITEVSRSGWKHFSYVHIGRIKLQIYGHVEGVKREWIDTDAKPIEDHLEKMVESFRLNHVAEMEREESTRQAAARRAYMASRRKMAEQRTKRESDRLAFLQGIADARREADDLRYTIANVPDCEELPADYRRMLKWADERLMRLEEQTSVQTIQASLEAKQLFANPDPLHDPEGDPPPKMSYWDD
ncbi:hypothetical protein ACQZ5N_23900 [Agrobacterium sp. 22-221-1]|uniref:Uncharacterized protein n=1 Tax=Agrobacterium deltaense NCPPB 1641 TaxID=1183425 RepID=A0A1S7TVS7_9HYPH|nr:MULTISPECIES: hypothetical protein [Agrobacterium]WFS68274.1 hypothetical protein CFBP4996_19865 [Agrobacterium leguminum]CVI58722.1 conserved hypothetical protein [Agrobacterium deltaense NCPPB 1641]